MNKLKDIIEKQEKDRELEKVRKIEDAAKSIRITSIAIEYRDNGPKVSASYDVISSAGRVLETKWISSLDHSGKSEIFVPPIEVLTALARATALYRDFVSKSLGLN